MMTSMYVACCCSHHVFDMPFGVRCCKCGKLANEHQLDHSVYVPHRSLVHKCLGLLIAELNLYRLWAPALVHIL